MDVTTYLYVVPEECEQLSLDHDALRKVLELHRPTRKK